MRTYTEVKMVVDNKDTAKLEIIRECNTFHVYENDANVFNGGWTETKDFTDTWIKKWEPLAQLMRDNGAKVSFEGKF